VGVGTFIGRRASDAEAVLEQLLPDLGFASTAGLRQTADLRVWNGHTPLHGKGIVAVGDAASLCDPFLAEGLRPSLMSGCEAAVSLDSWLKGLNLTCPTTQSACANVGAIRWLGDAA
jgi:2-polyprenyl-6-methoxyphenol hydroxylase-like FAD-dependent oxidoreductase